MSEGLVEPGIVRSRDGAALAYERSPGDPPGAVFVHATGFCKEVWRPVADGLESGTGWVAVDQPGHGDSERPPLPIRWSTIGNGVLDVLGTIGSYRLGVGHSAGGAALVMAEVIRPGTFDHLVLIEPIIFPPPHERHDHSQLAELALKRRSRFASRDAAVENFTGKGPFAKWDDRVLGAYAEGALRPEADGFVLKCDPETEAEFYRGGADHDTWDHLPDLRTPVTLVVGQDSTTHHGRYLEDLADRFPNVDLVVVEGATHFLPMEQPELIAAFVDEIIDAGSIAT
ncbi:MAG: alpha/beta hydrolase [Actinomycetota bacterium]